jgi:hypothetical protein
MCGLAGWNGTKYPTPSVLKLLHIYNRSRGVHSCGMYYRGSMFKGARIKDTNNKIIEDTSDSIDFTKTITFEKESRFDATAGPTSVLLHTRHATVGSHTAENAHPFEFLDSKFKSGKMILAHNGSLTNTKALAAKYGIKPEDYNVDSQMLGLIIKDHGWKVLKEYEGAAALSIVFPDDDPNKLYLWAGASKLRDSWNQEEKDLKLCYERPLHYCIKDGEFWYSSEKEHLASSLNINLDDEKEAATIKPLPANTIITVKNGKILSKYKIERDQYHPKSISSYTSSYFNSYYPSKTITTKSTPSTSYSSSVKLFQHYNAPADLQEFKIDPKEIKGKIIFDLNECLYKRNGHAVTGEFVFDIKGNIKIGSSISRPSDRSFYFYKGYLVKNSLVFNNLYLKGEDFNILKVENKDLLHSDSILKSYSTYIDKWSRPEEAFVTPLFSNVEMELKAGRMLSWKFVPYDAEGYLGSTSQYEDAEWEESFNTDNKLTSALKSYFNKFTGCDSQLKLVLEEDPKLNSDDLSTDDSPFNDEITQKELDAEKEVEQIEELIKDSQTEELNSLIETITDTRVEAINSLSVVKECRTTEYILSMLKVLEDIAASTPEELKELETFLDTKVYND